MVIKQASKPRRRFIRVQNQRQEVHWRSQGDVGKPHLGRKQRLRETLEAGCITLLILYACKLSLVTFDLRCYHLCRYPQNIRLCWKLGSMKTPKRMDSWTFLPCEHTGCPTPPRHCGSSAVLSSLCQGHMRKWPGLSSLPQPSYSLVATLALIHSSQGSTNSTQPRTAVVYYQRQN